MSDIRHAEARDLPVLVDMGRRFHEVSGLKELIGFDEMSFLGTLSKLMDVRGLLVDGESFPRAMAGVFAAPSFYNSQVRIAGELFWWTDPEHRGNGKEMLKAIECTARAMGAGLLHMSCLEAQRPEAVGKLYQRAGYRPVDHLYHKAL